MLALDAVQTLALGGLALFAGYGVLRLLPILKQYNLPAPVIGGLLVAITILVARRWDVSLVTFDTSLQSPLMIAFFTTIGCNASFSMLRISGRQVAVFLGLAAVFAIAQCVVGMLVALGFGLHPLFGVLAGATTLAGGPATGLAFAPLFEKAGVIGAESIAVASAMAGIIGGGLVGGPVATWIVRKYRLHTLSTATNGSAAATETVEQPDAAAELKGIRTYEVIKSLAIILVAMWLGSWVSAGLAGLGITLPAYIGAMLVGALIRNVDDSTGWIGMPLKITEEIGSVCLAFFLSVALMSLKLWELSGLAVPLLVNMIVQLTLVVAFCLWPVFQAMGRDYDAAVMTGGFVGFMLGTTANAMAVMRTLVERYGPAPRAFLVAPLVGAFFIDFTNAMIITTFINLFD